MKKYVIIHTTNATIDSIGRLIREQDQECRICNLLDDSILPEINEYGRITPGVRARLYSMLQSADMLQPAAIMSACSSIGQVIEEGAELCKAPVLRIDLPMAEAAVQKSSHISVLATLESTLGPTTELIRRMAAEIGRSVQLSSHVIDEAGAMLKEGDTEGYDSKVAVVIQKELETSEVVLLAQASMARCMHLIPQKLQTRVFTSPESGVAQLLSY